VQLDSNALAIAVSHPYRDRYSPYESHRDEKYIERGPFVSTCASVGLL
jgi:hypothetical protein